jgi:hypothetical protein
VLLDPTATAVLKGSRGRRFWLIVGSLILIVASPVIATTGSGPALVATGFGVLFFAAGMGLLAVQLLRPDRLTLAHDDFSYRNLGRRTRLAWSDVAGFGLLRTRHNQATVLQVGIRLNRPRSTLVREFISGPAGDFDSALPETYGLPVEDLLAIMEEWRLAANQAPGG